MKDETLIKKIEKLPMWAQDHIKNLTRQREEAVTALNEFTDDKSESGVYYEKHPVTGEQYGPSWKKRYIQTDRMEFEHAGIALSVHLTREDDCQRPYGIEITYSTVKEGRLGGRCIALVPRSFHNICLVAKENMQ